MHRHPIYEAFSIGSRPRGYERGATLNSVADNSVQKDAAPRRFEQDVLGSLGCRLSLELHTDGKRKQSRGGLKIPVSAVRFCPWPPINQQDKSFLLLIPVSLGTLSEHLYRKTPWRPSARTPSNTWKAVIRKRGWPTDHQDLPHQARCRGLGAPHRGRDGARRVHQPRRRREAAVGQGAGSLPGRSLRQQARQHRLRESQAKALKKKFGAYSLAAITPDLVAEYRDERLAAGKSASTVRLELALLSHLFTIAIKEWRVGLVYNPVANIRKPAPTTGRDRRLSADEEKALFKACDSTPTRCSAGSSASRSTPACVPARSRPWPAAR